MTYTTLKLTKEEFHDIIGTVSAQRKVVWDVLQGRIKEGRIVGAYEYCETPPKLSRREKEHYRNRIRIYDALMARFDGRYFAGRRPRRGRGRGRGRGGGGGLVICGGGKHPPKRR